MTYLNCSRCGLSIPAPRVATLTPEYCPRCIATRRIASPLFASPLTLRELTDAEDVRTSGSDETDDPAAGPHLAARR
jgi:hypothetical protein